VSEFVPVPQTRRVFIRKDGKSGAEGEDGKRMKLMYLFCGHPHMLLGERRAGSPREDLTARRMAETTWPGSTAEYQPSVIAFVCKGRLFPSRATSSITTHPHPASRFFMARTRASVSRPPTCRYNSARVARTKLAPFYILQQKWPALDCLGFSNDTARCSHRFMKLSETSDLWSRYNIREL